MRITFKTLGISAGVLLLGAGCASQSTQVPVIEESWLARVPEDRLDPIYEARSHLRRADDDVARSKVQLKDAENQIRIADAQLTAAKREHDVAKANLNLAEQQGQRPAMDRAEKQLQVAELGVRTAEQRLELAEERADAAESALEVETAQADVARVALSRAEFEVLRDTGDTRVEEFNQADFDRAAANASARESDALQDYRDDLADVQEQQTKFEQLQRQLQAARAGTPSIG